MCVVFGRKIIANITSPQLLFVFFVVALLVWQYYSRQQWHINTWVWQRYLAAYLPKSAGGKDITFITRQSTIKQMVFTHFPNLPTFANETNWNLIRINFRWKNRRWNKQMPSLISQNLSVNGYNVKQIVYVDNSIWIFALQKRHNKT